MPETGIENFGTGMCKKEELFKMTSSIASIIQKFSYANLTSANYSTPLRYSRKNQYLTYYSGSNSRSNSGSIFASGSTQIHIFWTNINKVDINVV